LYIVDGGDDVTITAYCACTKYIVKSVAKIAAMKKILPQKIHRQNPYHHSRERLF